MKKKIKAALFFVLSFISPQMQGSDFLTKKLQEIRLNRLISSNFNYQQDGQKMLKYLKYNGIRLITLGAIAGGGALAFNVWWMTNASQKKVKQPLGQEKDDTIKCYVALSYTFMGISGVLVAAGMNDYGLANHFTSQANFEKMLQFGI